MRTLGLILWNNQLVFGTEKSLQYLHFEKYFLRFSYKEEVTLTKTPVKEQIICSVDLGINTDAVWSMQIWGNSIQKWNSGKENLEVLSKSIMSYERPDIGNNPAGFKPTGYFFAHFQNEKPWNKTKNLLK